MKNSRLEQLMQRAKALAGEPLIVRYETPSGEIRTGTLDEWEQDECIGIFRGVVGGSSLKDLRKILDGFRREAERQAREANKD